MWVGARAPAAPGTRVASVPRRPAPIAAPSTKSPCGVPARSSSRPRTFWWERRAAAAAACGAVGADRLSAVEGIESLDDISPTRRVLQKLGGHRTGNDDVIASFFALQSFHGTPGEVCDMGTGHGSVTLILSQALPDSRFVGVEIQDVSADLCRRNLALNGLSGRAECVEGDVREVASNPPLCCQGGFDLVTGTPPFKPLGSGTLPKDPQRQVSRFEFNGGIEDYCIAAAQLVKPGGVVCMVMDGRQDVRTRKAFAAAGLRITGTMTVYSKPGQAVPRFRGFRAVVDPGAVGGAGARGEAEAGEAEAVVFAMRDGEDAGFTPEMMAARKAVGLPDRAR